MRDVSLQIAATEAVAIMGPSGSGKTTLLNVAAGTDLVTSGAVVLFGSDLAQLRESERTALRARGVGLVFQDPHLLPGLTALENVAVAKLPWRARRDLEIESRALLEAVGLGHRLDFPPARLSGGERQRVGIARALLGRPKLLLADEPTGNLDGGSKDVVLQLLRRLRVEFGFALLLVTHDDAVAALGDRTLWMRDGRLGETSERPT
jgi:putative ABC transport system ATP-binding protein